MPDPIRGVGSLGGKAEKRKRYVSTKKRWLDGHGCQVEQRVSRREENLPAIAWLARLLFVEAGSSACFGQGQKEQQGNSNTAGDIPVEVRFVSGAFTP